MEEADYRFFITRIEALDAETAGLKQALKRERASFDEYIVNVQKERFARRELDVMREKKVAELEKEIDRYKQRRYIPGIILGGGYDFDGDGVKAVVGLGWKVGP